MRRTNIWIAALTVLAACLGGLGAGVATSHDTTAPVLVVARTVLRGEVIGAADLGVAEVSAPGVRVVPAADKPEVVGRRALATLPAGSLLSPESFGAPTLPDGTAQVSLRLGPSQMPDAPLPGGQRLMLIGLPAVGQLDDGPLVVAGQVVFPPVDLGDGTAQLDVAVDSGAVAALAPYLLDRRVTVVAV